MATRYTAGLIDTEINISTSETDRMPVNREV